MSRKAIPSSVQDEVLISSRRRCCICFGLFGDLSLKRGQIAHLDHNRANDKLTNLAFLCLEHHDEYDSKSSQSKALRESEVKHFRDALNSRIERDLNLAAAAEPCANSSAEKHSGTTAPSGVSSDTEDLLSGIVCSVTFNEDGSMTMELIPLDQETYVGPFVFFSDTHCSCFAFTTDDRRGLEVCDYQHASCDGEDGYGVGFRTVRGPISARHPLTVRMVKKVPCGPRLSFLHVRKQNRWKQIPMVKIADHTLAR